MTKISVYNIDEYVTADDKWIGTDVNTYNKTKNFTPRKLSHYFNNNQVINTGVDLLYKYFTITPPETRPTGTLSFETEIGPTVNFSAISTFLLSKTTLKGNYIVEFFDFLVGTNVLLYKAKNINLFGSYKIVSVEEYLPEPNFFVVNVEFIDGNGFIEEDEDYMISLIDISGGGGDSPITIENNGSLFSTGLDGTGVGSDANFSTFFGLNTGFEATGANNSIFIGQLAGSEATIARDSIFMGWSAGKDTTDASYSNFFGNTAGNAATDANYSNFFGVGAGFEAINVSGSNFFGSGAGGNTSGASYSNLFGYEVGRANILGSIGSNNIIIGTSISLPTGATNSINIGGVLFGTNTNELGEVPSIIPSQTGKIGIGVVEPTNTLHIYSEAANTSGLRLERLTSSSPTSTGQAIGVDASGNVVTVEGGGGSQDLQSVTDIGATTTNGITIDTGDTYEIGLYAISSAVGIKGESRETYGVQGYSNSATGVYGNSDNGYGVQGYSESGVAVYGNSQEQIGVQGNSYSGTAIFASSEYGTGLYAASESNVGVSAFSNSIGLEVNGNGTIAIEANLGNSNKGLVINSGTSSTGNFIELDKNGVDKLTVNQAGELTATKLIKQGGTSAQLLVANGDTITAGTNITISGGTISSTGGGGSQDLQSVLDIGSIAYNTNVILSSEGGNTLTLGGGAGGTGTLLAYGTDENGTAIRAESYDGTAINAQGGFGLALYATSYDERDENDKNVDVASFVNNTLKDEEFLYDCSAINVNTIDADGIRVYTSAGNGAVINLGLYAYGITVNSGASSVGNPITIIKNGVNKLVVNQSGDVTANKLIKQGGFDYQFLKADGSVDNNTYLTSADLPSTLDLYATTSLDPVIAGYTALVRNISDSRYNTVAVDVPTPTITGTLASPTFCGAVISDPSILLGNPGVFNFSVIGKIRRTGGSTSSGADFFYSIYKRDLAGVETLIVNSAPVVVPANGGIYVEYISIALWNNGIFLSTDRVVLKFYGIKTGGGSGATYQFQFGGTDPVRGTAAISSAIIPNLYLRDLADVEKTPALNNEILYWNDPASLWEHSLAENLVPLATATQKGLVSTTTQTFAGAKTFTGAISASNLSGTNTGDQSVNTLTNVSISSLFNGDVLQYESSTSLWKNKYLLVGDTDFGNDNNTYNSTLLEFLFASKQDTLQSTVNIKSINGNSILGGGNLTISASPASQSAFTMLANNTAASAVPTEQPFENLTNQTYSGTIVWTGGAAPTISNNTYSLSQVGNLVTLTINLAYGTVGGSNLTSVAMELPSTAPAPALPSSVTTALDIICYGTGGLQVAKTFPTTPTAVNTALRIKSTGVYEVVVARASAQYRYAYATIQYFV